MRPAFEQLETRDLMSGLFEPFDPGGILPLDPAALADLYITDLDTSGIDANAMLAELDAGAAAIADELAALLAATPTGALAYTRLSNLVQIQLAYVDSRHQALGASVLELLQAINEAVSPRIISEKAATVIGNAARLTEAQKTYEFLNATLNAIDTQYPNWVEEFTLISEAIIRARVTQTREDASRARDAFLAAEAAGAPEAQMARLRADFQRASQAAGQVQSDFRYFLRYIHEGTGIVRD